ncbi:Membrane protein YdfJ [Paraconexibacter sp. AEG42_29]|uniref:Membrane protein YdfJ n=1 Tax=Paraconexibacter sp. AEG42_29 TaxID=2997339 RepID=A0AAU7ARV1_9ACTN
MTAFTRWILAHRRLVVGFWIVLTVVGMATAGAATKAMDQKFSVPGKEGWETNLAIARAFQGTGGNAAPLVPVVALTGGRTVADPGVRADLEAVEAKLAKALPGVRVAGFGSTGDRAFTSADGRTAFVVAYPRPDPDQPFGDNPEAEKSARAALRGATVGGAPVHLSGYDALLADSGEAEGPGVLVEALVGGLGALLVLAFVFGSFLAIVPILMAIPAIMTSFLTVYALTAAIEVSPIVQFLIALIGLGVAIDYSLLVVVRWREEQSHGAKGDEAIINAMETAGRSVVFSGTTVAIGLLALIVLPLPFLRSVGIGGMVIPLLSVAVSLSLLPVVLHAWGEKLDWPHRRTDDKASAAWTRWAEGVVKRRWTAAGVAMVMLALLVAAATQLQPGVSDPGTLAKGGPAKVGLQELEQSGIGGGALLPHELLTTGDGAKGVATAVARVDGVHGAVAPVAWTARGESAVLAFPVQDGSKSAGRDLVDPIRDAARGAEPGARLGGQVAQNADFIDAVYGSFPLMIVLIAVITFILLARAFRSLLLPAKAVLLNIISVAAAWGVLQLVWQSGHGSEEIFGIAATGSITAWIPLMVFAFLFGLSMDYEVFILARMREEYDATGDTDLAVIRGIGRTGRLVTSAAIILFLAFVSMASGPQTDVKVLATGLAAGILLDATIIRALLVPAVVSLFGRWNWVLPVGAAKLLRVEPSLPPRDVVPEAA